MTALVGVPEGGLCAGKIIPRREKATQAERAGRVTAFVGAAACGFGTGEVASPLEQHAEIRRGRRVAVLIGVAERGLRSGQVVVLRKYAAELEGGDRLGDSVARIVVRERLGWLGSGVGHGRSGGFGELCVTAPLGDRSAQSH